MLTPALIPLILAVLISGGIICYCFPSAVRGFLMKLSPQNLLKAANSAQQASPREDEPTEANGALIDEVSKVRKLVAELNKGRLDLEWSERSLADKSRRLDSLMEKAEEMLKKAALSETRARGDKYTRAGVLLEMGLPPEEIKKRFGLMSAELDLMDTVRKYKGNSLDGDDGKKPPHQEDSSRSVTGSDGVEHWQVA